MGLSYILSLMGKARKEDNDESEESKDYESEKRLAIKALIGK